MGQRNQSPILNPLTPASVRQRPPRVKERGVQRLDGRKRGYPARAMGAGDAGQPDEGREKHRRKAARRKQPTIGDRHQDVDQQEH